MDGNPGVDADARVEEEPVAEGPRPKHRLDLQRGANGVRRVVGVLPRRVERGEDRVPLELVDDPVVSPQRLGDGGIEQVERAHEILGGEPLGERSEALEVEEEDRRLAQFAEPQLRSVLGGLDEVGDFRRHEAREVLIAGVFGDRVGEQAPVARHGIPENGRHHKYRYHLVDLGPDQHAVRGHVMHVVVRDHRVARIDRDCVRHQHDPAHDCDESRRDDLARVEVERAQRDEYEHVEERGRLEVERWWLLVLQMEAPDQAQEQRHVDADGEVAQPFRESMPVREVQAQQRESEIGGQHPRHRLERGVGSEGFRGHQIDDGKSEDHRELDPAHQNFARLLLRPDPGCDAGG